MKYVFKFLLSSILILFLSNSSYAVTKIWCVGNGYGLENWGLAGMHPLPGANGFNPCPGKLFNKISFDKVIKHYSSGEGKTHLCNMLDGSDFNNPRLKVWFELAVEIKVKCKEDTIPNTEFVVNEDKESKRLAEQERQKRIELEKKLAALEKKTENKTVVVSKSKNTKPTISSTELMRRLEKSVSKFGLNSDNNTNLKNSVTTSIELKKAKREAEELRKKLAALEKKQKEQQQSKPKSIVVKKPKSEFPLKPIPINFPSVSVKRDDIAVIIGNANYKKQGKDIPNVNPAYADAEGIKQYFMKAKGVREGNIIYFKDATNAQLLSVFGNEKSHKGKLFNYIKPNKSNVYIYYAGHGAPGEKGDAYLVPTDTDSQTIEFTGYPLSTLYSNLGKLPAKSMTVILEACFSGGSQSGSLISRASPIVIQPKKTFIPNNIKVIAAGSERQMASWEEDSSHSLFTKYFLKAMSGEGDSNKDGKVSDTELKDYLSDTMTYYARRYYGRDQKVQIHNGG